MDLTSGSDTNDSDFAASESYGSDYDSSSSETLSSRRQAQHAGCQAEEVLASGDEGVVESGKRKRKRRHKKKGGRKRKQEHGAAEVATDEEDEDIDEEGVGARLRRRREGKGEP